jgi:hypothetical protein
MTSAFQITARVLLIGAVALTWSSDCSAQRSSVRNTFSRSFAPSGRSFTPSSRISTPRISVPRITNQILSGRNFITRRNHQPDCYTPPQPPIYSPPAPTPIATYPVVSQPAIVQPIANPRPAAPRTPLEVARQKTSEAKALFAAGKYSQAEGKLDAVVKLAPKDSNAYQFRALTHLAQNDFDSAAADAYDAMLLGNSWTREVVATFYARSRLGIYDNHIGQLQRVAQQEPSMQTHFLLAYHHLVNQNWLAGQLELEKVLALQPDEPLSTKLLAVVKQKSQTNLREVASQNR